MFSGHQAAERFQRGSTANASGDDNQVDLERGQQRTESPANPGVEVSEKLTTPDRWLVAISLGCSVLEAFLANEPHHFAAALVAASIIYVVWILDMSIIVARFPMTLTLRAKGILGTGVLITYTFNQHLSVPLKELYIYAPIIVNVSMVLRFSDVLLEQVSSSWVGPPNSSSLTSNPLSSLSSTDSSLEPPPRQLTPTPEQ